LDVQALNPDTVCKDVHVDPSFDPANTNDTGILANKVASPGMLKAPS
jgi:hypothetical protein